MNNIDKLKEKIEKDYKNMMAVINSTSLPLFVEDTIEDMHILISTLISENKELKEMLKHRIEYTNKLEKDLFENCSNYVVSKDKIKAKIEPKLKELDKNMKKEWQEYGNSREYQDMEDEWNFLQSLLGKE